jgi:hypothetical protein
VASPREGGGKRAGRHRRMANWADRAAEWPRPSGEEKKMAGWGKKMEVGCG